MTYFPGIQPAAKLEPGKKRLYIGAYGFEDRSVGWMEFQKGTKGILDYALMIKYHKPKGKNRIEESKQALSEICTSRTADIIYNVDSPYRIEDSILEKTGKLFSKVDEIVLDISAMTKLLILAALFQLKDYKGDLRIIYCEPEDSAPAEEEYRESINDMQKMTGFPSSGVESIIRLRCLSSIRMQGQPVTMIAFTSFNEQLVRHMLGTISPHRLIFINGHPNRNDNAWREKAMQEIHKRLIAEYPSDNKLNEKGLLERTAGTLDYRDTVNRISEIYNEYGTYERIICAATGTKMQTVGLFFAKVKYLDIHIEYPTPDSYFVKGYSKGIRSVNEILIPGFADFIRNIE